MIEEERIRKELVSGMASFLNPENGYSVQLDLAEEVERGLELGLTEDQVYAFIQGYSVAYDRLSGLGPL